MNMLRRIFARDQRRAIRQAVDFIANADHAALGSVRLHVLNLSTLGFMAAGTEQLSRHSILMVHLPVVGTTEAVVVWTIGDHAGFRFDSPISAEDLETMLIVMQFGPFGPGHHQRHRAPRGPSSEF